MPEKHVYRGTCRSGKRAMILLPVFCLLLPLCTGAAPLESLPPYHYLVGPIEDLRIRGRFSDLDVTIFPYMRRSLTQDLVRLAPHNLTRKEVWMQTWLREGLAQGDTAATIMPGLRALRFSAGMVREREPTGKTDTDRWITGTVTARPTPMVLAVTTVRVDQRFLDDPEYVGKRFRGMAGLTEQAYLRVTTGHLEVTFGRDWLWWGPGRFGQLMLSNLARPLDQVRLMWTVRAVTGVAFAAQLDPIEDSRRYLSGHRFVWRIHDRLTVGGSEVVLYGGPNRPPEWNFLNPLPIYAGESINDEGLTGDNNVLWGLDFRGRPTRKSEVYGELLIDDFQVEKKTPGDLEPDEIGILIGGQWADPGGLEGMTLGIEYTRVWNRTYNQVHPWNRYLHRNQSLGYRGNDMDDVTVEMRSWLRPTLRGWVAWRQVRHGEGRMTDLWTTPWMAYTVEQGYSEPFPTGVVERTRALVWEIEWHPKAGVFVTGRVDQEWVRHVGHISGRLERRTRWMIVATLWGDISPR
ncbi:MAG: hypothetical protein HY709_11530 [Candidatus Latescibacteria bacterium]|nr:hypothetical protein [Candidatus Latescibacterota bacterium]